MVSIFENVVLKIYKIIIFTDSNWALEVLENGHCANELTRITLIAHQMILSHNIGIAVEWVSDHSGIPRNDMVERFAKRGAKRIPTATTITLQPAKQLIKKEKEKHLVKQVATGDRNV